MKIISEYKTLKLNSNLLHYEDTSQPYKIELAQANPNLCVFGGFLTKFSSFENAIQSIRYHARLAAEQLRNRRYPNGKPMCAVESYTINLKNFKSFIKNSAPYIQFQDRAYSLGEFVVRINAAVIPDYHSIIIIADNIPSLSMPVTSNIIVNGYSQKVTRNFLFVPRAVVPK